MSCWLLLCFHCFAPCLWPVCQPVRGGSVIIIIMTIDEHIEDEGQGNELIVLLLVCGLYVRDGNW